VNDLPDAEAASIEAVDFAPFRSGQTVILASCDGVYFKKFAVTLVRSTVENSGLDCFFHFHIVNPDDDVVAQIRSLRANTGCPSITASIETVDLSTYGSEKKTYYACSRFLRLPALLDRYRAPTILIDMDMVVLRPLQPLLEHLKDADFGLVGGVLMGQELWNSYWADFIAIRPTARASHYFRRVAAYIDHFIKSGLPRWFLDQIALYAALHAIPVDEAPPALVLFPQDIHRFGAAIDPNSSEPSDGCYLWSLHFSNSDNHTATSFAQFKKYQGVQQEA
jgi:hypothetical protein